MTDPREFTDEELIEHMDGDPCQKSYEDCPKCAAIRARLTRRVPREWLCKMAHKIFAGLSHHGRDGQLVNGEAWVENWLQVGLAELGYTIDEGGEGEDAK